MIVVQAGNRADEPGREPARFPADREAAVHQRMSTLLDVLQPHGVVTAAAAGADLLFVDAARMRRVPVHLVLPFERSRFRDLSVADRGARWVELYDRLVADIAGDARCSMVELANQPDEDGFRAGNQALLDRAILLAERHVIAVAVRPRRLSEHGSMTDDFVERAERCGLLVIEIDPSR